jgi:hypothetical protein
MELHMGGKKSEENPLLVNRMVLFPIIGTPNIFLDNTIYCGIG